MKARVLDQQCQEVGQLDLPAHFKDIKEHNLYLYIKHYRALARANTAKSKNRGEVSGGGRKPWSQKGGGRARAGSITSPVFVGGGVSHGATNNRNYDLKINKKQKRLALEYALAQKALNNHLVVVDQIDIPSKKTKDASAFVKNLGFRDVLLITRALDEGNYLAFRNLKNCYLLETSEVNAYWIAAFGAVVVEKAAFEALIKAHEGE
ncbi:MULTISPECIES: 50S ribosomal protein L4 [Helicobacter]|uniref:50S ribosomal protein L4 n=1 Tax=Helicobacter TaxID=209 RepID=UPI000CF03FDA|nr:MULTISPECIES: 50S ribosomal protein L4 [Helicobacter]BEG57164.1 50S ribosomal protein L4 [Helicobacter sp. NHP21005]